MVKSIFAGIIALLILSAGAYPQEMTGDVEPLMKFASFAVDKQLTVNEWTITMKQKISWSEAEEKKRRILSSFVNPVIETDQSMQADKYIVTDRQKNEEIVETYTMVSPKNSKSKIEMVYTIKGQGTPPLAKELSLQLNDVKSRLFGESVTIFTCLKASKNGMIDDVLVYKKFKEAYNVATIDEVDEKGWTSRSGITKEWGQSIPLGEQLMNVQFSTRTLGGETTITIGTPIITAEY
ncbi:YwmB family TATA-box binding protein [Halobacillus litoralis]|uniref:YwmB family TATA-box binding protein n=1 Tax=Halobacillus litoralis TaxID=45668 RepID=UPI001CFF3FEA|nr:YwmB family TATA-box binding protein [Halobacillus litoralis]